MFSIKQVELKLQEDILTAKTAEDTGLLVDAYCRLEEMLMNLQMFNIRLAEMAAQKTAAQAENTPLEMKRYKETDEVDVPDVEKVTDSPG